MRVKSLPRRWHIVSILLETGWGISAETCELNNVFPSDDRSSGPNIQFMLAYDHGYPNITTIHGANIL